MLFDLFERPPKTEQIVHQPVPAKPEQQKVENVLQAKPEVLDQNNPLKSQQTQNYIAEKLNQHRQSLID
jgi:hypothetical protein